MFLGPVCLIQPSGRASKAKNYESELKVQFELFALSYDKDNAQLGFTSVGKNYWWKLKLTTLYITKCFLKGWYCMKVLPFDYKFTTPKFLTVGN